MKITGQDPAKAAELGIGKGKGREPQQPAPPARDEAQRPASLPANANLTTQRVRESIRTTPEVRAEKVAELRERLKNGSFQVDADRVAGKMLKSHLREDLERP